ncbi:hypothetical protein [Clostridium estertheticum]|nr:hypothetical protein [Clostridium estertheticum]
MSSLSVVRRNLGNTFPALKEKNFRYFGPDSVYLYWALGCSEQLSNG